MGRFSAPAADCCPDVRKALDAPLNHLREMFHIAPANNDHRVAIRCGIGIGVPLLTLLLLGRIDLAIFVAFGAFTGIYGRNEPHRQRLGHQMRAGTLMFAVILAGVLTSRLGPGEWGIVLGTTVVAGLGTVATGFWRLRPAGSLFHIFAYAAISSVPGHPPIWQAMLAAGATIAFALLLGCSGMLRARYRTPWEKPVRLPLSSAQRKAVWTDGGLYAVAAASAGSIATLLGIGHNYWAMVAATVPLVGATFRHRIHRGINRMLGTFGGLGITAVILLAGLAPWQLVLVIALLQCGAELFIARNYALAQVVITPLALLSTELSHASDPVTLIQDRAVETVIGAAVGMALVILLQVRANRVQPRERGTQPGAAARA
ncbi:FUSC family protein [Arthrobacter sp. BL-252-APC-1A]|uniref:FUSC family protein n=1 Tax=Arthrobacter sp. BL-252-APC-1A TaxID=2606622 RepID=UPI001E35EB56|nr:FUSC family protein [Arthrobacter sp. BL-252-APC-1A]